jgi:hypothetical protein
MSTTHCPPRSKATILGLQICGAAVLGEGLNGTPFNGRMAEVMVWNRTLTDSERVAVDEYLKAKY